MKTRTSDKLNSVISWLENSENDLLLSAGNDEIKLHLVAEALVAASNELQKAAEMIAKIEDAEPTLSTESLDELASLAEVLDKSGDEDLKKYASTLDMLLMTIASPKGWQEAFKKLEDSRIEELKRKYVGTKEKLDERNKISGMKEAVDDSKIYQTHRVLSEPLDTRYCPDHSGVQVMRVGEREVQCALDGKVYSYLEGFTKLDGTKVPGSTVELQSSVMDNVIPQSFDPEAKSNRSGAK